MDAMVADHERSTGPWEIEWVSLPEIFCLMSGALKQTKFVLKGLEVDATRMRANIDITNGLVMSEAVMMGLGPYIGREYAHDLVYDLCRQALAEDRPLVEILAVHPEIARHVSRAQLDAMCDPANYLGQAGVMVDRVLAATLMPSPRCACRRSPFSSRGGRPACRACLHFGEELVELLCGRRQRAPLAADQADLAGDDRIDQRHADQKRMVRSRHRDRGYRRHAEPRLHQPQHRRDVLRFIDALRAPGHIRERLVEQQAVSRSPCSPRCSRIARVRSRTRGASPASGWSRRQAATKRSSSKRLELDVVLLPADEIEAEVGFARATPPKAPRWRSHRGS